MRDGKMVNCLGLVSRKTTLILLKHIEYPHILTPPSSRRPAHIPNDFQGLTHHIYPGFCTPCSTMITQPPRAPLITSGENRDIGLATNLGQPHTDTDHESTESKLVCIIETNASPLHAFSLLLPTRNGDLASLKTACTCTRSMEE